MLAPAIALLTTLLTLAGIAFAAIAMWAARSFLRDSRRPLPAYAPPVSILKPVKGVDPGLYEALASHCRQTYAAPYELLIGLSDPADPAQAILQQLQSDFPAIPIRNLACPQSLGANGKVSTLAQLLPQAAYEHILIADADIRVSPGYLTRIFANFAPPNPQHGFATAPVGLVTAPYRGRAHGLASARPTLGSRLEALAIATDFFPGVLTARLLEGGIRFGLGSTLATTKTALNAIGGLAPLTDHLADDYQLGARIARASFQVLLSPEIVETSVAPYTLTGFWAHQLRWARTVRDSRPLGYLGLALTHVVPWALLNAFACGATPASLVLLLFALIVRAILALTISLGILNDRQIVRDLWLLPVRDCAALVLWAWSYADDTVVWRGRRLHLSRGTLKADPQSPTL